MPRLRTLALFFLLAIACTSVLQAQTTDDIIQKHIAAIGGQEAWNKITTVHLTGSVMTQGVEVNVQIMKALHRGFRLEGTAMGMTGYTCMNTKDGWSFWPMAGQDQPEPMDPDAFKAGLDELSDMGDPFIHLKENGDKAEYTGKETLRGVDCYKILLTHKSGKTTTIYIDPTTYYAVRSSETSKAGDAAPSQDRDFSNYHKLPEGIWMPMTVTSPMGPVTIKKVEINPHLDDRLFTKG